MVFTGVPVMVMVTDAICRITGISLLGGASGTISLDGGPGQIKINKQFNASPYEVFDHVVGLDESIEITINVTGPSGVDGPDSAMFFGQTAGTGYAGPTPPTDYPATVAVGAAVPFPQDGPFTGTGVTRTSTSSFTVSADGRYRVSWHVSFLEESELHLAVNGTPRENTTAMANSGDQQNSNTVLLDLLAGDVVTLVNPAANATALTVQPATLTLTHAQAPSLTIEAVGDENSNPPISVSKVGADIATFVATISNNSSAPTAGLEIYAKFHT